MSIATLLPMVLKTSLALLVLALGLTATVHDAIYLFRRPRELIRALLAIFVIMPLVAVILAQGLNLHPAVKIALVTLALSPLPPTFPKKALKEGGRVSYIAGLLVAATLFAVVSVPLSVEVIQRVFGLPLQMGAGAVLALAFWSLILPLAVGIIIHQVEPAFAERAAKPVNTIANVVLLVGLIPILVRVWPAMVSLVGNGTILVMILFVLVGLAAGHLLAGLIRATGPCWRSPRPRAILRLRSRLPMPTSPARSWLRRPFCCTCW